MKVHRAWYDFTKVTTNTEEEFEGKYGKYYIHIRPIIGKLTGMATWPESWFGWHWCNSIDECIHYAMRYFGIKKKNPPNLFGL